MTLTLNSAPRLTSQLARLGRPQNVVYPGLLAIEAAGSHGQWAAGFWCYALLLCLYNLAAGYNNIQDVELDRHNNAQRNPLVSGKLSARAVYWWLGLNALVILALQWRLNQPGTLLCSVTYIVLLYAYSGRRLYIQGKGFWATALLAICYGSIPLLLAGTQINMPAVGWLAALQAVLVFPYLLAKDYKDERGDRLSGKRTPLVRYGVKTVQRIAATVYVAGCFAALCLLLAAHRWLIVVSGVGLLAATGWCISQIHHRRGVLSQPLVRLMQGLLLALNYLLFATIPL